MKRRTLEERFAAAELRDSRQARGKTILRQGRKVYTSPVDLRALKRAGDSNRLASIGACVAEAIRGGLSLANVTEHKTTSGAPLIRMLTRDGMRFHCTITRARGKT